ncbi:hypothetical protein DJ90_6472 [Paenibacillus macerans]|uniref:Uncharacterized protein n=1 Tax=Paenibacillus macerans TaxID=44252 RepID=A0A090Y7G6_PAEMA|nr:hypothetical protein DJ90_6472 [Paenibacillus macerans]
MVRAMHGAKCRSQRVDSSFIYDADAFVEVGILNPAGNIVFLTADGTDFRFYGNAFGMSVFNDFLRHGDVFVDRMVGAVDHNGSKSGVDRFLTFIKTGTMIKMDGYRNGNFHVMQQAFHHFNNGVEAAHMAGCTLGYAKDYRGLLFFGGSENRLGPFQVVDVVLTHCVFALKRFVQHVCHRY